jgi:threonine dehydratase
VATEDQIESALALAQRTTSIDVSPTGSAGLAGLMALRAEIGDHERVAVVFSGVLRR